VKRQSKREVEGIDIRAVAVDRERFAVSVGIFLDVLDINKIRVSERVGRFQMQ